MPSCLFKDKIERRTYPLHWISMLGTDTKDVAPSLMKMTGVFLGRLFSKTHFISKWRVKYTPDGFLADIKQAWTNRCHLCPIDSNEKNNFDYSYEKSWSKKCGFHNGSLFHRKI